MAKMKMIDLLSTLIYTIVYMISPAAGVEETALCHLKSCSNPQLSNSSVVKTSCEAHELHILGRCCLNKTSVIGLDLSLCNLVSLDDLFKDKNYTRVQTLVLDKNPLTNCSRAAFQGLFALDRLYLPTHCDCPGESDSVGPAWTNVTVSGNTTACSGPIDLCVSYNQTCPNNQSYCEMMGPGVYHCLCKSGYHGYKCLRQGTFPFTYFLIGLCSSTFVLSLLLWFVQRRKVLKAD